MKLALYHPWIYVTGGIERTLLNIASRSRHDWTLYTHHYDSASTFPGLRDARIVVLDPQVSVRRALPALAQAAYRISRTELPLRDEQGLLVSSEGLGDFILSRNEVPTVCYCHTPLKILHDPVTRAALRSRSFRKYAALRTLAPGFNAVDRRMWKKYQYVLANSQETAHRIERAGLPAEEIEVLHPGVDLDQFTLHPTLPRERFFLVAGRIMWEKRIELAIQALRVARQNGADASLVIAGGVDSKSRPYLETLRQHAAGLPVEFLIHPSDEELAALYARCMAVVFTAPNEDWGIVPLEAMASGAPVLAVDAGGPRESVIHNVTGWLLPPTPWAFAEQMKIVADDGPNGRLVSRRATRRRAQQFAADTFVQRLDDVMEEVVLSGSVERQILPATKLPVQPRQIAKTASEDSGA
ncbi:MAG TPA: glycosyltransferase [Mycobacteriales bacterium]|nr:glycosyltransferase [Mycobacteriales bacterium]HVX69819.1 glycosyltransferase [Mycobacteriales bacterium]